MVEAVRVLVVLVVRVWVLVVVSVVFHGCKVARLGGCKGARVQGQTKRIFAPLLLWFDVGIIDYFCTFAGLYWFGDGGGGAVVVWCGGGLVGVVVAVAGRGWQAIPPYAAG